MTKVSVIVPTFNNTADNLNRLIESMDNQTMNQNEFEVLFVDDGSSDMDSYIRLKNVERKRENYTVKRINASGWGSKPRNLGTKMAQGEYIFYCDDDDTIFPQSLERMYTFAKENKLDVVNPKVIKSKGWSWGWKHYKKNVINAQTIGVSCMRPMTVPKLYRKQFLISNNIQFPEGNSVWWEDVMFSCLVYSRNPKAGILSDYPIYHWRQNNRSASFLKNVEYKWSQLTNLASFFEKHLKDSDRSIMTAHWYKTRVLKSISKGFHKKQREIQNMEFVRAKEWRNKFVDADVISHLDSISKVLDFLLYKGKQELVLSLSESRSNVSSRSYLNDIRFSEDKLLVSCSAYLTDDEENNVEYIVKNNKTKIHLPKDVERYIPKKLRYYTDEDLNSKYYLPALKGRYSRVTWNVKDVSYSKFSYTKQKPKNFSVSSNLQFQIDIGKYAIDRADYYQPWDIATRFSFLDAFSQKGIACVKNFRKAGLINNNTYVVYKNKSGLLSLDLNSNIIDFFSVTEVDTSNKLTQRDNTIIIPLKKVHVFGESDIALDTIVKNNSINGFVDSTAFLTSDGNDAFLKLSIPKDCIGETLIKIILNKKVHDLKLHL